MATLAMSVASLRSPFLEPVARSCWHGGNIFSKGLPDRPAESSEKLFAENRKSLQAAIPPLFLYLPKKSPSNLRKLMEYSSNFVFNG